LASWVILILVGLLIIFVVWPFFVVLIDSGGDMDEFVSDLQNSDSPVLQWLWNFSDAVVSSTGGGGGGGGGGSCSFQWPSGGGYYTTDPGGNQMYVAGAGGEPSASDCYNSYGTNVCIDPNGSEVNMDALCSAYPCTPLCERLGLP
jgi:hypothetical protein